MTLHQLLAFQALEPPKHVTLAPVPMQQLLDERLVLCTGYKAGKIDETTFEQDFTTLMLEVQKLNRRARA